MLGDFDAAFNYYARALPLAREVGNLYIETYQLINLSANSSVRGDAPASLEFSQKALELSRRTGDKSGEAWSFLYMGYAYLMGNDFVRAEDAFRESIHIREELGQPGLEMEPLAGLIQARYKSGDLASAAAETETVLEYLKSAGRPLDGTEEPLRVYHACYQVLKELNDPRSKDLLRAAGELLDMQVSRLRDETSRRMFVENVPWRKAIHRAWQEKR